MSVRIRYRLSSADDWTVTEINRDDPFAVCNAVRARLFPGVPLPERDEKFEAVMAARKAAPQVHDARAHGRQSSRGEPAAPACVRDTSMAAYRSLEWSGKLTKQQRVVHEFMLANRQRDYTRQELGDALQMSINRICGRVKELIDCGVVEEVDGGRRRCRVTGENANTLRLVGVLRMAA